MDEETKRLVNMLFIRFMAIYGHKFKSAFQSDEEIRLAKREWALSLRGATEKDLMVAVERCKAGSIWMPSIAEFLELMRPEPSDLGLPDARSAYQEACLAAEDPLNHAWSHRAVYHAGRATGWYPLRAEESRQVFGDFDYYYQQLCRRVQRGEKLEPPLAPGLEDRRQDSFSDLVRRWGERQGVTPEQAATLLYYLTKPSGSPAREALKRQAENRRNHWGLALELPDSKTEAWGDDSLSVQPDPA